MRVTLPSSRSDVPQPVVLHCVQVASPSDSHRPLLGGQSLEVHSSWGRVVSGFRRTKQNKAQHNYVSLFQIQNVRLPWTWTFNYDYLALLNNGFNWHANSRTRIKQSHPKNVFECESKARIWHYWLHYFRKNCAHIMRGATTVSWGRRDGGQRTAWWCTNNVC